MPLLECKQGTESWHLNRLDRITASLAAACLGLDPYTSRQKAWRTIMGTEPRQDNSFMKWGREKEPAAVLDYECLTGNLCAETGFWVSLDHPWLGASPDRLVGEDGLLEVKCPGSLPARVPIHHRIQMLVQLHCTGRIWCDYFAWTPEGHYYHRILPSAGTKRLIARLAEFYLLYVTTGIEPPRKRRKTA